MKTKIIKIVSMLSFIFIATIANGQMKFLNENSNLLGFGIISENVFGSTNNKLNKGVRLAKIGNYKNALLLFKKAWTLKDFRKAAFNNISVVNALKCNYYLAGLYLEKAIKVDSVFSDILLYNQLVIDGLSENINFFKAGEYEKTPHDISKQSIYNKAVMMSAIGDFDYSNRLFNLMLLRGNLNKKKYSEIIYGKSFCFLALNNIDSVFETIENFEKKGFRENNINFIKSYTNKNINEFNNAIAGFKKSKKYLADNSAETKNIGYCYLKTGDSKNAGKYLGRMYFCEKNAKNITAKASGAFLKSKYNKARKLYLNAITKNNKYMQAYIGLGNTFLCIGKSKVAENYYKKAQSVNSSDPQVMSAFARLNYYNGRYREADKFYEETLIFSNNDTLSLGYNELNMIGYTKLTLNKISDALIFFNKALEINKTKVESKIYIASVYVKVKKYKEAISLLDEYITYTDTSSVAYFLRGFAKQKLDNNDGAINDYSCAIKNNKSFISAYNNRAIAYVVGGNLENAKNDIEFVISKCKNGDYYFNRALIENYIANMADLNNNKDSAIDFYQKSKCDYDTAILRSFSPYMYNNLGILFNDIGDSIKAKEYYIKSKNQYSLNNLGTLLAEQCRYKEAYDLFITAQEIDSTYQEAIQNQNMIASKVSNTTFILSRFIISFGKLKNKNQKGTYYKTYLSFLDDNIAPTRPDFTKQIPIDFEEPKFQKFKKDLILMTSEIDDKGLYKKVYFKKNKIFSKLPSQKRKKFDILEKISCRDMKF